MTGTPKVNPSSSKCTKDLPPRVSAASNPRTRTGRGADTVIARNTVSIKDKLGGRVYLADSGADTSVFPATQADRAGSHQSPQLRAANGTRIGTYGRRNIPLKFGGRSFLVEFLIADVAEPILGADFFAHHDLLIDIGQQRVSSRDGSFHANAHVAYNPMPGLHHVARDRFEELLDKFPGLFTPNFRPDAAVKHQAEHFIETKGPPLRGTARRLSDDKLEEAKAYFSDMEEAGICRRSNSPWASPLLLVDKADGSKRPCGDYRRLNASTVPDRYPLPHMHDLSAKLRGCTKFSVIDLVKGYHHIPMAKGDIPKTAIITPFGSYEFMRLPFGLKNASQSFQRLMDSVLQGIPFVFIYLDDVLIASPDSDTHYGHLEQVLQRLHDHGLTVNRSKCHIHQDEVRFLGHKVSRDGVAPLAERVEAIQNLPSPTNKLELQRILGSINFYRRFVPKMAEIVLPLTELTKTKGKVIAWNNHAEDAFQRVKTALAEATMLVHPSSTAPTALTTDASDGAIGAELAQRQEDGQWKPIAFFSRRLTAAERKYAALDKELTGVYSAIKHFRWFVEGRDFTVYTDHRPLTTILTSGSEQPPRRTRQLAYVSEFTTDLRYVKGEQNVVADLLSRPSEPETRPSPTLARGSVEEPATPVTNPMILAARLPDLDYAALARDQANDPEVQAHRRAEDSLEVQDVQFQDGAFTVACDVSQGRPRPIIPVPWRKRIFDIIHGLSHAGRKVTQSALTARFVWQGVKGDIREWCKTCLQCQAAKVAKHTRAPLTRRPEPDRRFGSVHVDIVGPLPISQGYRYLFTITDRFTKWPEAIPMQDMRASTCANAFLSGWISRFGVPDDVTSDRGTQFTGEVWTNLNQLLGAVAHRTTAYHPQANGHVERWHRSLKAALRAVLTSEDWVAALPMVMLGLRSAIKEDAGVSPAELVYGQHLRIPGEFVQAPDREAQPTDEFITRLRSHMAHLRPAPTNHHAAPPVHVPQALEHVTHVLVRNDTVKAPLTKPYDGPFAVLAKHPKWFTLQVGNKHKNVTIDRLKPAHLPQNFRPLGPAHDPMDDDEDDFPLDLLPRGVPLEEEEDFHDAVQEFPVEQERFPVDPPHMDDLAEHEEPQVELPEPQDGLPEPPRPETPPPPAPPGRTTRSGRTSRPPVRYQDYDLATIIAEPPVPGLSAGGGLCGASLEARLSAFEFPALALVGSRTSSQPVEKREQTQADKRRRPNQASRQAAELYRFSSF